MLIDMARTRPIRSPSQPNTIPPHAAPSRKHAVIRPIQTPTIASPVPPSMFCIAGRATTGNKPISKPSNSQPRKAARRTIHWPRVSAIDLRGGMESTGEGEPDDARCSFIRRDNSVETELFVRNAAFVEHRMLDHRAFIGCVRHVNLSISCLDGGGISEITAALRDVAAMGKGLSAVRGNGHGKWGAFVEAVIINQQQMAVLQFDQIDRGIRIGELRILSFAPTAPAIMRFRSHQPTIFAPFIIAAAPAEGD